MGAACCTKAPLQRNMGFGPKPPPQRHDFGCNTKAPSLLSDLRNPLLSPRLLPSFSPSPSSHGAPFLAGALHSWRTCMKHSINCLAPQRPAQLPGPAAPGRPAISVGRRHASLTSKGYHFRWSFSCYRPRMVATGHMSLLST